MTEPTTPQVSPARREQVIDALIWNHHISEDGDIPFVAMADAAIAALLPDIDAMQKRIAEALYCAYQTENGICDRYAFYEGAILYEDAMQDAHALIYGEEERE